MTVSRLVIESLANCVFIIFHRLTLPPSTFKHSLRQSLCDCTSHRYSLNRWMLLFVDLGILLQTAPSSSYILPVWRHQCFSPRRYVCLPCFLYWKRRASPSDYRVAALWETGREWGRGSSSAWLPGDAGRDVYILVHMFTACWMFFTHVSTFLRSLKASIKHKSPSVTKVTTEVLHFEELKLFDSCGGGSRCMDEKIFYCVVMNVVITAIERQVVASISFSHCPLTWSR